MNIDPTPPDPSTSAKDEVSAFQSLEAELILSAIESAGFLPDGRLMALNSYENRVYQVGLDDQGLVIAKFYRPGRWSDEAILEEHSVLKALHEAEIPVAAMLRSEDQRTLFHHAGFRFALCPRKAGRPPELEDPDTLEALGRLVARMHQVTRQHTIRHREPLDPETFGRRPLAVLEAFPFVNNALKGRYLETAHSVLKAVEAMFINETPEPPLLLHGDLYAGNLLMSTEGPLLLDFDDARLGPPVQDLWMLAQGSPSERRRAFLDLVEGYETFATLPKGSLRLIEPLRTLRLIHLTGWIAARHGDPALLRAYPRFGTDSDLNERIRDLEDQAERLAAVAATDDPFPL